MKVRAGFLPLVDAAPLVVAARQGFAKAEGLDLELVREASWATVRDKLTIGHFDCAHLLAPIPVASQLGIGNLKAKMIAPIALSLNGNAISVSKALHDKMLAASDPEKAKGPAAMGAALAKVVAQRQADGEAPLTFGMVYPYSAHNYELRYWLAAAGIHPDRDVSLIVIPPPFVVDYLREGLIDGFCVGAPWNTIAQAENLARIVVSKAEIWKMGPEKVLGVRESWAEENSDVLGALLRALEKSARWADDDVNTEALASLLAEPAFLDLDETLIGRILRGKIGVRPDDETTVPDYLVFHRSAANFPWKSHALWFYAQMVRWGQADLSDSGIHAATEAFRPDIFRRVFAGTDVPLPATNAKVEGGLPEPLAAGSTTGTLVLQGDGFFDQRVFDPDDIAGYLAGFAEA